MASVTRTTTFTSGQTLTAALLNSEFDNLLGALALVAGDISASAITTAKINDSAVTTAKINTAAVTSPKVSLTKAQSSISGNTGITATVTLGTTLVTHASLVAGDYIFYGLAHAYVDPGADTVGRVIFEINDGSTAIVNGPIIEFSSASATSTSGGKASGFMAVVTLGSTTTVNLAAYKEGGITNAGAGLNNMFGYIRIG